MLSLLLTAFTAGLLWLWLRPRHGIDDADITLVYARNIALGHGYVYYPGGERVEGSTSLLWTLLCSLLFATGARSLLPLFLLGIGCAFVATLVGLELARRASGEDRSRSMAYAAVFLLACPAFFVWNTTTLMDVAPWSACVGVALLAAVSPSRAARVALPFALMLLVLCRPEGLLLAPALLTLAVLGQVLRGSAWRDALRTLVPAALSTLLTSAGLLAFRLWYFGDPVPNTYFAKVGGDRLYTALHGCRYVLLFLLRNPLHLATGLAGLAVMKRDGAAALARFRAQRPSLESDAIVRLGLTFMLLLALALPLAEGEDHFVAYRMMQPFVPLSCALLGCELWRWLQTKRVLAGRTVALGLVAAVLLGWTRLLAFDAAGFRKEFGLAESGRLLAARLEQRLERAQPLPTLGVTMAGGIAFGYDGRVLDLLGLNWRKMAHASRDRRGRPGHASFASEVFWSEPATLLLPRFRREAPRDVCDLYSAWENEILHGLLTSAAFRRAYVGVSLLAPEGHLVAYARRDWLAQGSLRGARQLEWPASQTLPPACSATLHDAEVAQQATQGPRAAR